jgi:hypothetical protein
MRMRGTLQSGTGFNSAPFVEEIIPTSEIQAIITSLGAVNAALYDFTDSASIFQDVSAAVPAALGDPIGRVNDLSGFVNHQIQATATARPLVAVNGGAFDGIDDILFCTMAVSPLQNLTHYTARSYVPLLMDSSSRNHFVLNRGGGSTTYFRQGGDPDTTLANRTVYSSVRLNGFAQAISTITGTNYSVGQKVIVESLYRPGVDLSTAYNSPTFVSVPCTDINPTSTYQTLGFYGNHSTVPTLTPKTERRAIWLATPIGVELTAEQRSLIRRWLKQSLA